MTMLPSLHISGFKGFSTIQIPRLGRVNLIVGKNNAGKTSLLEAIYLYATQGSPNALLQVLWNRHELRSWVATKKVEPDYVDPNPAAFSRLFHGCYAISHIQSPILIGPTGSPDEQLSIEFGWDNVEIDDRGQTAFPLFDDSSDNRPVLDIEIGRHRRGRIMLDLVWNGGYRQQLRHRWTRRDTSAQCVMVPSAGFEDERLAWLWDSVAATDVEEAILDALRLVDDRVERLYFVRDDFNGRLHDRTAVLKLKDVPGPVPLRHLGDGMNRVLGILLAIAKSKGGVSLVDEFENGIHYSVQADFLKLIFKVASNLNVQVFATTHSWDCIQAFQEAAETDPQEGYLIRLHRDNHGVEAKVFDENLLSVIARQDIEVR